MLYKATKHASIFMFILCYSVFGFTVRAWYFCVRFNFFSSTLWLAAKNFSEMHLLPNIIIWCWLNCSDAVQQECNHRSSITVVVCLRIKWCTCLHDQWPVCWRWPPPPACAPSQGRLSGVFCVVLCAIIVHSAMHTHIWTDLTVVCWLVLAFLWLYCVLQFFWVRFSFWGIILCSLFVYVSVFF